MSKKIVQTILVSILLLLNTSFTRGSSTVELSLLTCGTGSELYAAFGHTAVRVVNNTDSTDIIYNFGIFNFNDPQFYPKFINGVMLYMLGTQHTEDFIADYDEEGRWVVEQKINLPDSTTMKLADWLAFTRKPANRDYYYDFLRNNCSSKFRDIAMIMEFRNIRFDNPVTQNSFRTLIAESMVESKWAVFGVNILLSSLIDYKVTRFEEMFLPAYLSKNGMKATIDGTPLLGESRHVNQVPITHPTYQFSVSDPIFMMLLLLLISVFYRKNWLRNIFYVVAALLGVFLLYMWFGTAQTYVKYNYNILWLNPLYLLLIPFLSMKKREVSFWLLIAITLCQLITIVAWITHLQGYDIAFLPLMAMLLVYNVRALKVVRVSEDVVVVKPLG